MNTTALSPGRKFAVILAIVAILLGAAAVILDLVRGAGFNPRPLGAIAIGVIVIASVLARSKSA